MDDQLALLKKTPWRMLLIMDACRADVFRDITGRGETVRSPFIHTPGWLHRAGPIVIGRNPVYYTANPVVNREVRRRGFEVELVSVWKKHWSWFTELNIPSVHPMSVNAVVIEQERRWKDRPIIVHYAQPHCPYIGRTPLRMGRMGQAGNEFGKACKKLPRPDKAVKAGEITWADLREAYRANVELVWDAVRNLAAGYPDRLAVATADHGDLLGEYGGKYGHEGNFGMKPELREVPWLVLNNS